MSRKNYTTAVRVLFASMGFITTPLSAAQITQCQRAGFDCWGAYNVGCDVAGGFTFAEGFEAQSRRGN